MEQKTEKESTHTSYTTTQYQARNQGGFEVFFFFFLIEQIVRDIGSSTQANTSPISKHNKHTHVYSGAPACIFYLFARLSLDPKYSGRYFVVSFLYTESNQYPVH